MEPKKKPRNKKKLSLIPYKTHAERERETESGMGGVEREVRLS